MKNLVLIIIASIFATGVMAKSPGKFLKYQQITDKEVLIESTNGCKVLFTAYDNNHIGVTNFSKKEKADLIAPSVILSHSELSGSIYVEELDELMQITTTTNNGLLIKIDKKHFGYTFIDKTDQSEIILEEGLFAGVVTNMNSFSFVTDTADHQTANVNSGL